MSPGIGLLATASLLGSPLLGGAGIVRAGLGLRFRREPGLYLGAAWLAGTFLAGLVLLGALLAGLPLHAGILAPLVALPGLMLLRRTEPAGAGSSAPALPRAGRAERAAGLTLSALALLVVADRCMVASLRPVVESDEAHGWGAKAKVLYVAGGFGPEFVRDTAPDAPDHLGFVQQREYPLLGSLLHLWVYVHAGGIVHAANRLPLHATNLALLLLLGGILWRTTRPAVAGALVFLVATTELLDVSCRFALADGLCAAGLLGALAALERHLAAPGPGSFRRLALVLAFLLWTKRESYAMVPAILGAAALVGLARGDSLRRFLPASRSELLWFAVPSAVVAFTVAFNARFGFRSDLVSASPSGSPFWAMLLDQGGVRAVALGRWILDHLFLPSGLREARGLPLLGLLVLALAPRRLAGAAWGAPAVALAGVFFADVLVLLGNTRDLDWQLEVAGARIFGQLLPSLAALVGPALGPPSQAPGGSA